MSSKEHAEYLAQSVNALGFMEVIQTGYYNLSVQVIARLRAGQAASWAKIVERLLLMAESLGADGYPCDLHVCRLYFLKNGKMVYGWHINITSEYMDEVLQLISSQLSQVSPRPVDHPNMKENLRKDRFMEHPNAPAPPPGMAGVQRRQISKRDERRPRRVLEADAAGNPIVPREHMVMVQSMDPLDEEGTYEPPLEADARGNPVVPQGQMVWEQPMAGLDPNHDRNAPTKKKGGAFSMFESQTMGAPFSPPKRGE